MLRPVAVSWGSDPEGFFAKDGQIVGSEKLIPKRGLAVEPYGTIVRDGVQFELNPTPGSVQALGNSIGNLLTTAYNTAGDEGYQIVLDGLVEVSRAELNSLSPKCRVLGCMPSTNFYGEKPIMVDPLTYRKRSSGGHIHTGILNPELRKTARDLVPVFDILVGNTCVLLDRDPGSAERRENYGRAGEHRMPRHGVEYRTTSNFWLRDYSLMSFVFGMAGMAVSIGQQVVDGDKTAWNDLAEHVQIGSIVEAINTNDFQLALRNFKGIVPFFQKHLPNKGFPLRRDNLDSFIGLAETVERRGIERLFPTADVYKRWAVRNKENFSRLLTRLA